MRRAVGLAVLAIGIVLLILGINAAESFSSDVSRFFTGQPTDRAVWMMVLGVAAIVLGGTLALLPTRALANN